MTQWDMVTVIIALVGLIFTVVKPLLTLNKTITTLNINMCQRRHQFDLKRRSEMT